MVSEPDSGSSVPGSSPGRAHWVVVFFALIVPLFTQVNKWAGASDMLTESR